MLAVTDKRQYSSPRIGIPILVIAPIKATNSLMVGLQGGRCERVDIDSLQPASFVKIGLKLDAATKVAVAIKAIFGV